ncbi:MAG TPA: Clp protease N-terminal domain-containing protein [Pilimelia sp.]|nr:Clp protease N-terminal domain-containing protein [Pilimelia sp.]
MFERFTKEARQIVIESIAAAERLGEDKAGPAHLLLALATTGGAGAQVLADRGITAASLQTAVTDARRRAGLTEDEVAALRTVGIEADEVFRRLEEAFGPDALAATDPPPKRRRGLLGSPMEAPARKVLELSLREAIALGDRHIGSEHVLLGLLRQGVDGPVGAALTARQVTYDHVRQRVLAARHGVA